ncbi:hypothetical protein LguiA_018338 [Lonicera macranthoides]
MDPRFAGKSITATYPGRTDIDQMPDTPNRRASHHRRAQSETFFRFPDDILLDDAVADFDLSSLDLPSLSDTQMTVDSSKSDSSNGGGENNNNNNKGNNNKLRSLSVDADFFDGLGFTSVMMMMDNTKKALGPDRLAELSLIDPKRAKRILANRQSAARSKERKIRYTNELERKVQTLQTEATTLSAQVTLLQRDTTGLTTENKELKLRLQAMEQQALLRDALNETLREEVQRLKIATGQIPPVNGNSYNRGLPPQYSSHQQTFHQFSNLQIQQQQQQQQQQLQMSHTSTNNQTRNGPQPSFLDFN